MEERPSMINESNLEIEQGLKSDRPIPLYAIAEFLVGHVVLNTIVANLFTVTL